MSETPNGIPDWSQVATQQELKHLKWALYGVVILTVGLSDRAAALFEYIQQGLESGVA